MYAAIAPYYDVTHAQLADDLGLVLALAHKAGGMVLELGCGTGRLLLPLARAGYTVTGLDSAREMLALARQKLGEELAEVRGRVRLIESDMTDLSACGRDYALIIIPYNTFMHLSPTQAEQTLRQARLCLQADGLLFIDLINPYAVAQTPNDHILTLEHIFTDPVSGRDVLQFARNHLDEADQILHITWIYDTSPVGGGAVHRTIVPVAYHYYYPHQLEILLSDTGWHITAWQGQYNQTPFREDSDRLLVLASPAR